MKYKEIEFKYNAENISLTSFIEFCEEEGPLEEFYTAGYDHFYDNEKDPGAFCRHRISSNFNQLTFKRKMVDTNNFIRTEHNLTLGLETTKDQVAALCSEFGHKHNVSIFKTCWVYKYEKAVLAYYVCYNLEMKETARFFEIEANEDFAWEDEKQAWDYILDWEKGCSDLGVSAQARIKRSLFELFRKQK